jgi:ssDNA-binding Zn-finger/Zn-ribbon topoisomerase 1
MSETLKCPKCGKKIIISKGILGGHSASCEDTKCENYAQNYDAEHIMLKLAKAWQTRCLAAEASL